jgi:hypothetical protein
MFGYQEVLFVLLWLVPFWILWRFYQAIFRIGEELGEIKAILRERSNPPTAP